MPFTTVCGLALRDASDIPLLTSARSLFGLAGDMFLFPLRIETLFKHYPWANWALIALTVLVFFGQISAEINAPDPQLESIDSLLYGAPLEETPPPTTWRDLMVLDGWAPLGLIGHVFLHADFLHVAGNMMFLWVFGNAVCGNTSNRFFPLLYLLFTLAAAAGHILLDGAPAIGASGAVNGVVGMALAMYPLNRVTMAYLFWFRYGVMTLPLWGLACVWLVVDLYGAFSGGQRVAYWAHLAGLGAGVTTGLVALRLGWVKLTEYDNRSLEEILMRKPLELRLAALRGDEPAPPPAPVDNLAADPTVMPATGVRVRQWIDLIGRARVPEAELPLLTAGVPEAERRKFELLYGGTFLTLGFSFHRSLADYLRCVESGQLWPHEAAALHTLLPMLCEHAEAMTAAGFIDQEIATAAKSPAVQAFLAVASHAASSPPA